jgi:hypothetical protein
MHFQCSTFDTHKHKASVVNRGPLPETMRADLEARRSMLQSLVADAAPSDIAYIIMAYMNVSYATLEPSQELSALEALVNMHVSAFDSTTTAKFKSFYVRFTLPERYRRDHELYYKETFAALSSAVERFVIGSLRHSLHKSTAIAFVSLRKSTTLQLFASEYAANFLSKEDKPVYFRFMQLSDAPLCHAYST